MVRTHSAAPTVTSATSDFATFGAIYLDVTDAERALGFWRDLVGLELLSRDGEELRLGVADRALLVLRPGAREPVVREASGLYHLSFHIPTLEGFARAFVRLETADYFQYPNDHGTHLANYVDDRDGIGLEFAFETPPELRATWNEEVGFEGDDGGHWTPGDPRYFAWLRAQAPGGDTQPGLPPGTIVGHVHLRVADIGASLAFYRDAVGFTVNHDGRPQQFFDMSAGGSFPHRLAGNSWESAGRPQRPAAAAGMRQYTLQLRSAADLDAAIARAASAGAQVEQQRDGAVVIDPSGTRLLLAAAAS